MTTTLNTANTIRNINSILIAPKTVKIIRDLANIKKPKILPNNKIVIFADKKHRFPRTEYRRNDTGIVIFLPEGVEGYYWSLDRKIYKLNTGENRLRFEFLNET